MTTWTTQKYSKYNANGAYAVLVFSSMRVLHAYRYVPRITTNTQVPVVLSFAQQQDREIRRSSTGKRSFTNRAQNVAHAHAIKVCEILEKKDTAGKIKIILKIAVRDARP